MGVHVTFDHVNKIIQVNTAPVGGEVNLDFQIDFYSDMKEDWISDATLNKLRPPITVIGGQPTTGSQSAGDIYFLDAGWKIRPYEADHRFTITGDVFSPDGTSIFTFTVGSFQVLTELVLSSLVTKVTSGSGLSPEQSNQLADIHGQVERTLWFDNTVVSDGNGYQQSPYKLLNSLVDYAEGNGITKAYTLSDITLTRNLRNIQLTGIGLPTFDAAGYDLKGMKFLNIQYEGLCNIASPFIIQDSVILQGAGIYGYSEQCVFSGDTVLRGHTHIVNGISGKEGAGFIWLDTNGFILQTTNWHRSLGISNMTSGVHTIEMYGGQLHLDAGCSGGIIYLRGNYSKKPENLGTTLIIDETEKANLLGTESYP